MCKRSDAGIQRGWCDWCELRNITSMVHPLILEAQSAPSTHRVSVALQPPFSDTI